MQNHSIVPWSRLPAEHHGIREFRNRGPWYTLVVETLETITRDVFGDRIPQDEDLRCKKGELIRNPLQTQTNLLFHG